MGLSRALFNVENEESGFLRRKVIGLSFLISINLVLAQVYSYEPITYSNIEINPSYIANGRTVLNANLTHIGSAFLPDKLYSDALRISLFSRKYFGGVGLSLNNTYLNDSTKYTSFGSGLAYRTVLFEKIFARIGLWYNITNYKTATGAFEFYPVSSPADLPVKKGISGNLNISLSFSSPADKYYISGGVLNYGLTASAKSYSVFPEYYFINVGDLGKILNALSWEISYTATARRYKNQNVFPASHYISILYDFSLTRRSKIKFGARTGWADKRYLQLCPVISFSLYKNRKNYALQLLINSAFDPKTNIMPFTPNAQLSLTFQF